MSALEPDRQLHSITVARRLAKEHMHIGLRPAVQGIGPGTAQHGARAAQDVFHGERSIAVAVVSITLAQVLSPVSDDSPWVDIDRNCFHLYEIDDPFKPAGEGREAA